MPLVPHTNPKFPFQPYNCVSGRARRFGSWVFHLSLLFNPIYEKVRLTIYKLTDNIFQSNKMPEEWRRSILVPIYKNKGDIKSCTNYREIKLMSHTMKLWERVIEQRLRGTT